MNASVPNPDRYKNLVVVLTMVTTVLTAVIAGLQADANIRAGTADRDSRYYAILASGELYRQGLKGTSDLDLYATYLKNSQESLVLQLTSLEQEKDGDRAAALDSSLQATAAQGRADRAKSLSIFFTDPRYAPKTPDEAPDFTTYLKDTQATAQALVEKQNKASDDYHRWNNKADYYVTILAVLAIALFLFGLAQALTPRLRLLFAVLGLIITLLAGIGALLLLVS